jgi:predicted dienelactone hydrolase
LRHLFCGIAFAATILVTPAAHAQAQSFRAGITTISVPDTEPFDVFVTYPTQAAEATVSFGLFTPSVAKDAAVAPGPRFPIVLFSHGNGRGGGTPLMHRELLLHLAREGFIVVAPVHAAGARPFEARPRQMRKALEQVLLDPRFPERADRSKIAMMGYSFGGAVGVLLAGGMLDLSRLSAYCSGRPDDPRVCDGIPTDGSLNNIPRRKSVDTMKLNALVLLDPFGAAFARNGLVDVTLPALIYYAQQSDVRAERNGLALANALPRTSQVASVPGSHFAFIDKCPVTMAPQQPEICNDPETDRTAGLAQIRQTVTKFLKESLK